MASLASTSSTTNQNPSSDSSEKQQECFQNFFQCWIHEQDSYLHQLISVIKSYKSEKGDDDDDDDVDIEDDERVFKPLVNRVLQHYETYYRIKSVWVKKNVLGMLAHCWRSSLEEAFLWIGGWRPSMAFHLLYSKSGLQLQARLHDIIRGLSTGDLADLSATQLVLVDQLQRTTIREENELTEKLAQQQETVADSSMVELSEVVTEMMIMSQNGNNDEKANETLNSGGGEDVGKRVESTLKSKEDGLEKILERANDLRLKTLKGVIEILSPIQAVYFLIAAAELHIRLNDWGIKKDANNQHQHQHQHGTGIQHSQQDHYGGSSTGTVAAVAAAAAAATADGGGAATAAVATADGGGAATAAVATADGGGGGGNSSSI